MRVSRIEWAASSPGLRRVRAYFRGHAFLPAPARHLRGGRHVGRRSGLRARKALDEPVSNGIPNGNHHDGGRLGGMLGCHCRWCACSDDDMHVERHQLCGEIGRAILAVVREPTVDGEILSFDPAEFLQPLPERRNHRSAGRAAEEKAHAAELCRPLASGGRAQGWHQQASDQHDDVPSSHATLPSRWRPPG